MKTVTFKPKRYHFIIRYADGSLHEFIALCNSPREWVNDNCTPNTMAYWSELSTNTANNNQRGTK